MTLFRSVHHRILFLLLFLASCASPPPAKKISLSERIEFDREIGDEILKQLEPKLSLKKENVLQGYLKRVGQTLADKTPDLHIPEVKVFLLSENRPDLQGESFAVPGGHVFLSIPVLKTLNYESEVSAYLSIQMGRLLKEQVLNYIRKNPAAESRSEPSTVAGLGPLRTLRPPENLIPFDSGGMFEFKAVQDEEAIDAAFGVLYAGGYDTRGMIRFLQSLIRVADSHPQWLEGNSRIAGLRVAGLTDLLEYARKRIVFQPPLRNPIVQSPEFLAIKQRLGKL